MPISSRNSSVPPISRVRRRVALPPLAALVAALVAGCQSQPQQPQADVSAILREQVEAHEAYVSLLQSVRDEETMKDALPKLTRLGTASAARGKQLRELMKSSAHAGADSGDLPERLQKALNSRLNERERIRALKGGDAFLQRLDSLGELHQ